MRGVAALERGSRAGSQERRGPAGYARAPSGRPVLQRLGPGLGGRVGLPARNQRAIRRYRLLDAIRWRSISAPYVGRAWWEFYIARMRVRAHFHGDPLTKREIQAVLDFLEYDSNERKVARAAQFETSKAELKRRFEAVLDERCSNSRSTRCPG